MSDIPLASPEQLSNEAHLEQLNLEEMAEIIAESSHSFLAPASDPEQTAEELLDAMRQDPKFLPYSYKVDGKPISYIIALSYKDPSTLAIGPMHVAAAYQGRGLGRKQVQDFNNLARQQGYEKVFTKTWLGNQASRKIFTALGFAETGIKPGDRANGDSTVKYLITI
jgi:RimJ/RimL family protein N-acetyltransferase